MIPKEIGFVIKLLEKSAAEGLLPIKVSNTSIVEVDDLILTSITPLKNKADKLADLLKKSHGLSLPNKGRSTGREGGRALWFGQHTLLVGPKPDGKLSKFGILTDQSDAWVTLRMNGDLIEDALMGLCPVDLRMKEFKRGNVVRTSLQHVNVTLHRIGPNTIDLYGFRSMAQTICHELKSSLTTSNAQINHNN